MEITEIQIVPIRPKNGLVAIASIIADNCLFLGSVGVYTRINGSGYRITYPTKKIGNRNINIYHPINKEISKAIEKAIILKVKEIFRQ